MERLIKLVCRPNKSVAPTKYLFKNPQVGRFIPLGGGISRCVASILSQSSLCEPALSHTDKRINRFYFSLWRGGGGGAKS